MLRLGLILKRTLDAEGKPTFRTRATVETTTTRTDHILPAVSPEEEKTRHVTMAEKRNSNE